MSKLEQLINELCPNGVEWIELGNILEYEQPTKYIVESTDYDQSYNIPVLTAGQTFILGYTNERTGIYTASSANPTIIFDDFTTAFHWVDFDFKVKSSAMKMLRPKVTFKGLFRYIYYAMKCIGYEAVDHSRHWISKYSHFEIPIPPLPVQEEIVRILDAFTDYTAELQAELQARREQYEYYRDKLLSFEGDSSVEWLPMGDVGEFIRGNGLQKKDFTESGVGCIHYGQIYTHYGTWATKTKTFCSKELAEKVTPVKPGNLVIACTSENIEDVCKAVAWIGNEDIVTGGHAAVFCHEQDPKFISYLFQTEYFFQQKRKYAQGTKVIDIKTRDMAKIPIPIPPLSEQRRIVAILDKFEALVNDLTEGLPAEIAARQEQYEYYRDKLLSFPKAV